MAVREEPPPRFFYKRGTGIASINHVTFVVEGLAHAVYARRLERNKAARTYFERARPSYRKQVSGWVLSAKQEATRLRRLRILIDSCAAREVIPALRWTEKKTTSKRTSREC